MVLFVLVVIDRKSDEIISVNRLLDKACTFEPIKVIHSIGFWKDRDS